LVSTPEKLSGSTQVPQTPFKREVGAKETKLGNMVPIGKVHPFSVGNTVVGRPPLHNSIKVKYGVVVGRIMVDPVNANGVTHWVDVVCNKVVLYC